MLYEDIRNFLGSQNFALTGTVGPELTILRNYIAGGEVFCVLIDNTKTSVMPPAQVWALNNSLSNFNGVRNDVHFIVFTDNVERDAALTRITGCSLWLVDCPRRRLVVYENQREDFYGLRYAIEQNVIGRRDALGNAKRPFRNEDGKLAISRLPYISIALILANIIYFIIVGLNGSLDDNLYLIQMGGNYCRYVFERLEVWRVVTGMFMHLSFSHLANNMLFLGIIGFNYERAVGHLKYFLIYMFGGIGAGIVSAGYHYLTDQNIISVGASGAVYALIGMVLYLTVKNKGRMSSFSMIVRVVLVLWFVFYSNFGKEDIDVAAHIGGLIFGFILSLIILGGKRNERR